MNRGDTMTTTRQARNTSTDAPRVDVVGTLDKRPVPGILPSVSLLALTAIAHALNMAWQFTDQIAVVWAGTALLSALMVTFGVRTWCRYRQLDIAIDAILPLLAPNRPTRELVRASKWTGWVGVPGRVRVAYAPPTEDLDVNRGIRKIAEKFSLRMGEPYAIAKHNPRRCMVTLQRDTATPEKPNPDLVHVDDVLTGILPGVSTRKVHRDDQTKAVKEIIFTWPAAATERVGRVSTQRRLLKALRDSFNDETLTVRLDMSNGIASVAPITPLPDAIDHPPRNKSAPMKVAFGQFRDGTPCIWDLDAPLPHVLIVGGTGGGKTVLLLSILTALPVDRPARAEGQDGGVEIWPIDPKRLGLFNLDRIPGARRSATREEAIVDYILTVKDKMDARYAYLEDHGPHLRETLDPIVLVIDEGEEMNEILTSWWKSGEGKEDWKERFDLEKAPTGTTHPAMNALGSILRLGREARVHVILASQQAASTWLTTSSRGQFAVRIALRNLEPSTSLMTFGSTIATSGLESKPGRAWVSVGMGVNPEHAQIYWTPKISAGLSSKDRGILHGLGIELPDDVDHEIHERPALTLVPTLDPDSHSATEDMPAPDSQRETFRTLTAVPETYECPAGELEPGMRILVDIDGKAVDATVDDVAIDYDGDDCLTVTYTDDSDEQATMSIPEAETVTVTE